MAASPAAPWRGGRRTRGSAPAARDGGAKGPILIAGGGKAGIDSVPAAGAPAQPPAAAAKRSFIPSFRTFPVVVSGSSPAATSR